MIWEQGATHCHAMPCHAYLKMIVGDDDDDDENDSQA